MIKRETLLLLKPHFFLTVLSIGIILTITISASGQCKPIIKVDGVPTVINQNDDFGLEFPFWLKEGQTLAVGSSVNSISVIEFTVNGAALEFSQILNITSTTPVAVPSGTVWKLESALKVNNSSTYKSVTFGAGVYAWKVPGCAEQICIEAWGGGGGGSSNYTGGSLASGAGGGGGGFGSECFSVVPGTSYTVTVGEGGIGGSGTGSSPFGNNGSTGGTSSVGSLISVSGGIGGTFGSSGGTGGTGGTSTAASNAQGANANPGGTGTNPQSSGSGGAGANGGAGGASASGSSGSGLPGTAPGGGGSGGQRFNSTSYSGGKGGDGKVIISW